MNPGYVYILINPSLPGLIKIGKTTRDSRERARELYSSGVPTPFQLAFEIFSEEHDKLEKDVHSQLLDFRVSRNREFFQYPLDKAIKLFLELNPPPSSQDSIYSAEDITERLRNRFPTYLKDDIVSVRIVQPVGRVWLEITQEDQEQGYLRDQKITRTDLGFISDGDGSDNDSFDHDENLYFNPTDTVSKNADKFINEYDPYSIIMTTDLFHEDACKEVNEKHNPHRR
jgi:hypothetical protein